MLFRIMSIVSLSAILTSHALELDTQRVVGELFYTPVASQAFALEVITQDDLKLLPVNNLADALEWVNGVDVRQRGAGVQIDLSIRGAGYEQTLVLLDGVRMNDAQTGHHNFNLPVVLEDIERIEIVRGPGAAQYGPNGNAGVINLVTRKKLTADAKKEVMAAVEGGSYAYERGLLLVAKNHDDWTQFASGLYQASDTYKPQTKLDYENRQGNYRAVFNNDKHALVFSAGYLQRQFGAQGFYANADDYANEYIKQTNAYLIHESQLENDQRLDFTVNYRHHSDQFYYLTYAPSRHETEAWQVRGRYHLADYVLLGLEYNNEQIDSSQVLQGNVHTRSYNSAFLVLQSPWDALQVSASVSYLNYAEGERFFLPVLGVSVPFAQQSLYANIGRSVRVPSMNDLHMNQAANKGNVNVKPEITDSAEIGLRFLVWGVQGRLASFKRDSRDAIDYTRTHDDIANNIPYFTARNIQSIKTHGFDVELDLTNAIANRHLQKFSLAYTNLNQNFTHQYAEARYSMTQLKHQAIAQASFMITPNMMISTAYKYEERYAQSGYHLWDVGFRQTLGIWSFGVSALNILNSHYVDSGYMEAPGSVFRVDVATRF